MANQCALRVDARVKFLPKSDTTRRAVSLTCMGGPAVGLHKGQGIKS